MEVAGQWRREWAGAAEYGKVTEGGVTRRVARAMEVLNASAPGARVRVMRAAYHSTSGPGLPTSSFMLHSSRRVISSGYNILESPTYTTKPLEISSTPLESTPDFVETENYKVTEPDDMDISEPSKWRGTTNGSTVRMPSEESSSTDNASIIDLDSRLHYKGLHRKYSCDSENSDIQSFKRNSARTSPLLDPPVALSTLKYKSLLNGSNDWNNRRKSYSFEDTSPINEIILQSNDTLAMESSTDSGICKSSEIVNDTDDIPKGFAEIDKKHSLHDESFEQWRLKNNPMFFKSSRIKAYREHDTVVEDPNENNITLQSTGKVSITVPITIEGDDDDFNKPLAREDIDRKVKKVEFCKTELHFAAESGKVNIIATDEKPPPTYDFRKRRSAFVSISNRFEKPITLFGEKSDTVDPANVTTENKEIVEFDENTAATKSILKNKIPKPKPYLLGENMVFGESRSKEEGVRDFSSSVGVCLINKQLQTKTTFHNEEECNFSNTNNRIFEQSLRTDNKGPLNDQSHNIGNITHKIKFTEKESTRGSIAKKFSNLNMSPTQKSKSRQLRESELTYFGIDNYQNNISNDSIKKHKSEPISRTGTTFNDTFESVRLIKQIVNSAHNSEAESEESPEYQNIPMNTNFAPVPTPRSRVKYKLPDDEVKSLGIIAEHTHDLHDMRRSRSRKQESGTVVATRSISEPAKKRYDATRQGTNAIKRGDSFRRNKACKDIADRVINKAADTTKPYHSCVKVKVEESPLYINIKNRDVKEIDTRHIAKERNELINKTHVENDKKIRSIQNSKEKCIKSDIDKLNRNNTVRKKHPQRTEKLSTPEYSMYHKNKSSVNSKTNNENSLTKDSTPTLKIQYASKYLQRKEGKASEINKQKNKVAEVDSPSHSSYRDKNRKERDVGKSGDTISSTDRQNYKKEVTEINKNKTQYTSDSQTKTKHIDSANKDEREKTRRPSRRSEYVIKYDDQNGTVSSVCKVKAGHSASRKKHISKDRSKEERKETKKTLEKPALLELPDHHRNLYGRHEDRKRYTKYNVQRACQLL